MVSNSNTLSRPKVILSAAIRLDGQLATLTGDDKLSNTEDWKRVHHLRAKSDAIMVGGGTILSDDSKLIVRPEYFEQGYHVKDPIRVVVTSSGNIPINARVISSRPDILTIIATTSKCQTAQRNNFLENGCEVIICGEGPLVNLQQLLQTLFEDYNVKSLMVEGGSKLNGSMLTEQLIDEIHVAMAPVLGGAGIPFFSLPYPINSFDQSPFFKILDHRIIGDMICFRLAVHYESRILH